jgi:hypothetical protein
MISATSLQWRVPVAIAGKGRAAHGRVIEANQLPAETPGGRDAPRAACPLLPRRAARRQKLLALTFAPGETTKTITIEVKGDSKREADETFYLDLFGNSGNALLTKKRGLGTIRNDD